MEEIRLIHFGRAYGVPDASPFCIKVEAYLRMLGLEYTLVRGNPTKSPRGQLPVLLHGSAVVAGSTEIVDYLRGFGGSHLDDWLSSEDQVHAYHLLRSVEEYLYFILLYQRWVLPGNFKLIAKNFFGKMNPVAAFFLSRFVRHGSKKRALAQGVGRYSPAEIDKLAYEGMDMMSRQLADKDFFFGDRPCWVDCSMYGFVANLLIPEFTDGACGRAGEFENLVAYEERFRELVFPDFGKPGLSSSPSS